MSSYKVWGIEFDSKEEAIQAEKELQFIKSIENKYDITNKEIAESILIQVKNQNILKTKIGKMFIQRLEKAALGDYDNTNNTRKEVLKQAKKQDNDEIAHKRLSVLFIFFAILIFTIILVSGAVSYFTNSTVGNNIVGVWELHSTSNASSVSYIVDIDNDGTWKEYILNSEVGEISLGDGTYAVQNMQITFSDTKDDQTYIKTIKNISSKRIEFVSGEIWIKK